MQNYKQQFKGKKITVMGLGILGRGLGYTKFLAECGADLIVTDLKSKEQLASSLDALAKFKNIKFTIGKHKLEDFRNRDIIMKMAGVPLDSIYIEEAQKTGANIEMDVSLFIKSAPKTIVVGVTGTRGKSMTTMLIYEILKANEKFLKKKVYLGGNIRGVATLPLLKKVKAGDILVCELDSWQLQGFGEAKISPHISVFTNLMPDHMNYYKNSMEDYFNDKALIFKNQKAGDVLITSKDVKKLIQNSPSTLKGEGKGEVLNGKIILPDKKSVADFKFVVPGEHQRQNLAYAVEVAKQFKIPIEKIKKAVGGFGGVEGRLQYLRNYKGIKIYNDNNATTPEATIAGIKALNKQALPVINRQGLLKRNNLVLICGGADKKLDLTNFVKEVNKNCKAVSLIPGTGTDYLIKNYKLKVTNKIGKDLKEIVKNALGLAVRGDIILFSPAFASFGMFNNEYERNDLFMKIIKGLK